MKETLAEYLSREVGVVKAGSFISRESQEEADEMARCLNEVLTEPIRTSQSPDILAEEQTP